MENGAKGRVNQLGLLEACVFSAYTTPTTQPNPHALAARNIRITQFYDKQKPFAEIHDCRSSSQTPPHRGASRQHLYNVTRHAFDGCPH